MSVNKEYIPNSLPSSYDIKYQAAQQRTAKRLQSETKTEAAFWAARRSNSFNTITEKLKENVLSIRCKHNCINCWLSANINWLSHVQQNSYCSQCGNVICDKCGILAHKTDDGLDLYCPNCVKS